MNGHRTQKKQRAAQRRNERARQLEAQAVRIRKRSRIERIIRSPRHGLNVYRIFRRRGATRKASFIAGVAFAALVCKGVGE